MTATLHRFLTLPGLAVAAAAVLAPSPPGVGQTGSARPQFSTPVLGVAINAHHISDLPLYLESVDAIADLGANTLLLVTPMFQERADSNEIRYLPDRCPTPEQLIAILRRAEERRLQTILLPIVLIEEPGEKDWRGVIRPTDREAWWASYERLIDRFLDIAVECGVDAFSVGSELNSFEGDAERWRQLIERVRSRYRGKLTYTANWDRYENIPHWSMVDFVGISSYFELSPDDPNAPVGELTRAWVRERRRILAASRRHNRPFLLMEVGYPSVPWAAAHPWDYVPRPGATPDAEAQARCWTAFLRAWVKVLLQPNGPALGFNCYYWDPYHQGGDADMGYGIRGKPALDLIRTAFARITAAHAE